MDITVTSTIYGFGTTATTNETSATYNGVTFTFDTAMPVGYFESGEPFVVSSSAFNITAISPASAQIDATYWGNGAMQDPFLTGGAQGFDEMLSTAGAGYLTSTTIPYSAGLNVDPAVGGSIAIAQGQETSIVKSVRVSGVANSAWQQIEKYVTLTVLSAAPATGAIRPAPSELTTKTIYTMNDIDLSVVRDLTMPGSFSESATTSLSYIPDYLGAWGGENGEQRRRFRLDDALHGGGTAQYSAYVAPFYARAILQLHSAATPKAKKYEIASLVVRHALQLAALRNRGAGLSSGAGQGGGVHPWLWAGAFLLKDASLLSTAQTTPTLMTYPLWFSEADTATPPWDKDDGVVGVHAAQPVLTELVGFPAIVPDAYQSNLDARYTNLASFSTAWDAICLVPFYNFGGDWTSRFVNGAYDTTNRKAALVALMDRMRSWNVNYMTAYNVPAQWKDIYDVVRTYSVQPQWTGVPEQPPYGNDTSWDDDYFTAGDGQISWDFKSVDFATETVTRRDFRYSLDGIQWIEVADVATTGSQTGLLKGAAHWCGLRQVSASGAGAWSANYPYYTPYVGGSDRGKRTTTGTDSAAAPVNTVAPTIHKRLYNQWGYGLWEPAGASLGVDDTVYLACGNGYWTGYDSPTPMTFTYQWKRDGTPIGGATSQEYQRVQADAETALTCEITATNASGSASVTTAAVAIPALTPIPAGTIIDTSFTGSFALDYETELGAIYGTNSTVIHVPYYAGYADEASNIEDLNFGALQVDKTGGYPRGYLPLSRPLTAGATYRVQAQTYAPSGGDNEWTGDGGPPDTATFAVRRQSDLSSYHATTAYDPVIDETLTANDATSSASFVTLGYVTDIDITFEVGSGETALDAVVRWSHETNTGEAAKGDIFLTYLKISEVV